VACAKREGEGTGEEGGDWFNGREFAPEEESAEGKKMPHPGDRDTETTTTRRREGRFTSETR